MKQEDTRRLADAVLLEGYVLYPYRASSAKNQFRWAFGVLAPKGWSEAGGCEPWWCETQCLIAPAGPVRVEGALRFIQAQARRVEARDGAEFREVPALEVDGVRHQPWDEGEIREAPFRIELGPSQASADPGSAQGSADPSSAQGSAAPDAAALDPGARDAAALDPGARDPAGLDPAGLDWVAGPDPGDLDLWERSPDRDCSRISPFTFEPGEMVEPLGAAGAAGRLVRSRWGLQGQILITSEPIPAAHPLLRLRVRVENLTAGVDPRASREEALRSACIAAHLILEVKGGAFVSLLDPPDWAEAAAKGCRNTRIWPVLAGPEGDDQVLLASPIILYDHPKLAPESPGDFFDACEIDELLVLRTATLTEDEKRQARGTDPRAAAILERVERLSPEKMGQLHGALRDLHRGEMVPLAGSPTPARNDPGQVNGIRAGSRVRLRPGKRRTDAQDLLFEGCVATVDRLHLDVDGTVYAAVTVDGDPSAELHRWYGRFLYYHLDEVELLSPEEAECPVS